MCEIFQKSFVQIRIVPHTFGKYWIRIWYSSKKKINENQFAYLLKNVDNSNIYLDFGGKTKAVYLNHNEKLNTIKYLFVHFYCLIQHSHGHLSCMHVKTLCYWPKTLNAISISININVWFCHQYFFDFH